MGVRFIYNVSYRYLETVLRLVFTKRTYIQDVRSFKWKRLSCILFAYNYLDILFFQMHFPKPNYGPIILNYNQDQNDRLVSLYKMVVLTQFRKNGVYGLLKNEPNRWMGSWGQPAKCVVCEFSCLGLHGLYQFTYQYGRSIYNFAICTGQNGLWRETENQVER